MDSDKDFVEYVLKAIVSNPDAVTTDRTVDERGVLITIKVDPSDLGYVIGKKGSTIQALRTLARIVGIKNQARVTLKVDEPEGGSRSTSADSDLDAAVDELKI